MNIDITFNIFTVIWNQAKKIWAFGRTGNYKDFVYH